MNVNCKLLCAVLLFLIVFSIPLATFFGVAEFSFGDVLSVYRHRLFGGEALEHRTLQTIVWNLRLPRILAAIAIGGGLALTGAIIQAITGNIMAEPYTLGIQSGAGLFAAFSIAFLNFVGFKIGIFAFIGAMTVTAVVYILSLRKHHSQASLILTGVAISMLSSALTSLIIAFAQNREKVMGITFWMMGSLGSVRWEHILPLFIVYILGLVVSYVLREHLNLLSMGEDTATILGVDIKNVVRILFLTSSLLVGVFVSVSGSIGFVGLIIPHVVRRIVGTNHSKMLPASALLGSLFLIWADTFSRTIAAPQELPIGVLTALIGVPFFLYIMNRSSKGAGS